LEDFSGNRIAWREGGGIHLYDLNTGIESIIASEGQHPRISGNRVVWQSFCTGSLRIHLYDLSTGVQSITDQPASMPGIDGDRIVYIGDLIGGNYHADIFLYEIDSDGNLPIPDDGQCRSILTGSLEVKSSPSHAKIYINGKDTGKIAKWTFDDMAPGDYDVFVTLDGYATPETEHVTVMSEQTAKLHFHLKKGGTPVPEFPSAFLPATMLIGFLGAVLLIQRTREN